MRTLTLIVLFACLPLVACQQAKTGVSDGSHGRYTGVGHYAPGAMWAQAVGKSGDETSPAARPADDEQVVIVMDSVTGEVRQCGNLSGRCIASNPWRQSAAAAPMALAKHAEQAAETAGVAAPVR